MSTLPARTLILGATSTIAAEVACLLAARGARLHLVGRNASKLAAVAARCRGGTVSTAVADFDVLPNNARVVEEAIATLGGLDTVLIAHGVLGDQLATEASFDAAEQILRTNFTSVVALLIPLANYFAVQQSGRLAVITSVAGDRGRPRNYTYGAAKGALNIYLQGVRSRLYAQNVAVTTIKLGPVDTPMTEHHAKNLLFSSSSAVAADILAAMDARATEAYVPSFWGAIMPIVRAAPERIFQLLPFLSGR